jgi:hypothetical protein
MEPPISDWFRSLPYAIDSLANSVKVLGSPSSKKLVLFTVLFSFSRQQWGRSSNIIGKKSTGSVPS